MIQVKIKSKQYHGDYYIAKIYESRRECLSFDNIILDYRDTALAKGNYVESIEGLFVPVLKVAMVGVNRFIYFPKLRFNSKCKEFSYNLHLIGQERYKLSPSEKLFAGYISSGLNMFDAAMKVWQGKKQSYYIVVVKRLFNDVEFTEYLFSIMSKSLREELEARGINKGTIADEIASAVLQQDMVTGEKIRVPQNVRLWALGKASDVLERGGQQASVTHNTLIISPDSIKQQMAQLATSSPSAYVLPESVETVDNSSQEQVLVEVHTVPSLQQ